MNPEEEWRDRKYLPHRDRNGLVQLLTIRLADSLPTHAVEQIRQEIRSLPKSEQAAASELRLQKWLDAGHGACHLRKPLCAEAVRQAFAKTHGKTCDIIAWVVMPNHAHVLAEVHNGVALGDLSRSWKGPSALTVNRLVGRSGKLWFREYHDRFIRDDDHMTSAINYVHANPIKAGLCESPQDWPFSSARAWQRYENS
jgi:REP element-mobilizing transposase RayT